MFHQFLPLIPIAIIAAVLFKNRIFAYGLPLAVVFLKAYLTVFSAVYLFIAAALIVSVFLTRLLKQKWGLGIIPLAGYAVLSIVAYELFANFGVWFLGSCTGGESLYAANVQGLIQCYAASLPYSGIHFLRDIPVTILAVKGIELLGKIPVLKTGKSEAR